MRSNDSPAAPSVRELAALFASLLKLGAADRPLVSDILRRLLENHPVLLGLWCLFEPDVFGGNDPEFAGAAGCDPLGRFIPRWHRAEGALQLSANVGHDCPTLGGWYSLTRDCREEIVFGPYDEGLLSGHRVLGLCRAAPIMERDRFFGVAGIDVSLDRLRGCASDLEAIESAFGRWHLFLDENLRIAEASPHARRLLTRYAGSVRGGELPKMLREKLADGAEARGIHLRRNARELRVHVARHPYDGCLVLSLEEKQPARDASALSRRELEVFHWLEQGKTNPEIALILGISEHTVRHHLERVFAKLGVENRAAAIRFGRRVQRAAKARPVSFAPPIATGG